MLAALLLASALLGASPPPPGRLVEAVLATVQATPVRAVRPITLTRLREEARVALVARGATEAAFGPIDGAALAATLEWLIDQTLVAEEADRLLVGEVGREEVDRELARFRSRFASPGEFARFLALNDLAEDELAVTLARNLRVQRFVEGRVGQSVKVAEVEIDEYLRGRGVDGGPAAARDAVRAHLTEQRLSGEVKRMIGELRGRATIRILIPPEEAARE
ncbi:MAG TPA: hypothetical protein VLT47_06380 [Anaeromyxobacteraceae bacterium]|nr:hypothetical protein [Anaeromyxobacteraceae bacterium]